MSVHADAVLKGTNTGSVYEFHSGNSSATVDHISYSEVASRGITFMDMMAITHCEENGIPGWSYSTFTVSILNPPFLKHIIILSAVVIFNLLEPENISRALCGDQVGILIDQAARVS